MSTSQRSSLAGLVLAATLAILAAPLPTCFGATSDQAPASLISDAGWTLLQPMVGNASLETVRETGPSGNPAKVLRVTVNTTAPQIYNIQITQDVGTAVATNHLLRYQFWARATTPHQLHAVVEQNSAPYAAYVSGGTEALTPSWKEYTYTADSPGLAASQFAARLQVGSQTGAVEFYEPQVIDVGVDPTIARDAAALAPDAIRARIRKYRMADLTVRVVDRSGRPVPGAKIAVRQQRHAFLFGCNIFGLQDDDGNTSISPADYKSQQDYRARFTGLFNYATLPFYWGAFEPQPGHPDFPRLTWMAQWCQQRGITTKAHPLVWQEVYPAWAPNTPDQAIPLLHKRVTDIIDNMSGLTPYYDIINETVGAPSYQPENGESLWVRRDGNAAVTSTVLGWVRAAAKSDGDTHDHFVVNDYDTTDQYASLFRQLKARGSMPDIIGIQSHMHTGVWPMTKVWDVCERFAQFGVPIHFTETTVLSNTKPHAMDYTGPPATDWPSTPDGEAAQADYVEQFYTVLFSHPSLRAITWWDLSDKDAWLGAPAGLLRSDMTPKPAYDRLLALIKHKWWTNTDGRTGANGRYSTLAFYGDYMITAADSHGRAVTQHLTMPEAGGPKTITVTLP